MAIPKKYESIVGAAIKASGAAGVPGAFTWGADIAGLGAIWTGLIIAVANKSGHQVDGKFAAKLASGIIASVASYVTGIKIAGSLFNLIPGAGTAAAIGISSSLNMLFTFKLGKVLVQHFDTESLELKDFATSLATDLLKLFSVGTIVDDVKEAAYLATTFGSS